MTIRHDGDSWDIVSSVGYTALGVAAARALDAALEPPLANDPYAARFVAAAGEPTLAGAVADTDLTGMLGPTARWIGVRTRFFDDFFLRAAATGVRQAVILAAGLDCRALRLDWPAGTTVFEVDQPRVLDFKQGVLDDVGAEPTARRLLVATDLRDDWVAALQAAGFDPAASTAWSLEGLLPYLPGAAQDSLFDRLDELSAPGSHLAVELGPEPGQIAEFTAALAQLDPDGDAPRVDELWYDDPRRDARAWLAERGWTVTGANLVTLAAELGRSLDGLPAFFEDMLAARFFTAVRG